MTKKKGDVEDRWEMKTYAWLLGRLCKSILNDILWLTVLISTNIASIAPTHLTSLQWNLVIICVTRNKMRLHDKPWLMD